MSNSVDKDGCKVIFINLSALKERKVKFPLDARNSSRYNKNFHHSTNASCTAYSLAMIK